MIGASELDTVIGSRPAGDKRNLKSYVRALARAGLAVVLVEPNGKAPLDMRSRQQRGAEDQQAQMAAQAAGNPQWGRVHSQAGVYLATTDTTLLDRYVTAAAKRYGDDSVNLGIEVGRSNLLLVDCDTAAQVSSFVNDHYRATGQMIAPTVLTPGKFENGQWVHKDGGHFYFTLPEGLTLPDGLGAYKPPGVEMWQAYWADRQLLIPPSVRPEGAYQWRGGVQPLPAWLSQLIITNAAEREQRRAERAASGNSSDIDTWAASVAWADVLVPAGWTPANRVSNCGCAEWTAPGPHDNPKSATAHDLGCSHESYDGSSGHAPLHIWTDNPPEELADYVRRTGSQTMSKFQFVAATYYGGSESAAARGVGIGSDGATAASMHFAEAEWGSALHDAAQRREAAKERMVHDTGPFDPPPVEAATDEDEELSWIDKHAGPLSRYRNLPPVEYLIEGYVDTDSVFMVVGAPNAGKSFLMIDMAASLAGGVPWQGNRVRPGRVAYMVGEGLHGVKERIEAWEAMHTQDLSESLFLIDEPAQIANVAVWVQIAEWLVDNAIDVLIIDTLNRVTVGLDENSAQDMGRVVDIAQKMVKHASITVGIVHHNARGTEHGRGSTAVEGAVDTVILVANAGDSDERPAQVELSMTKQKNHERVSPSLWQITPHGQSAVFTAPNGLPITTSDPFGIVPPPPLSERDRIAAIVETIRSVAPTMGMTRSEIVRHVPMGMVAHRTVNPTTKYRLVMSALDAGVKAGHIETAIGSSARFIAGTVPLPPS